MSGEQLRVKIYASANRVRYSESTLKPCEAILTQVAHVTDCVDMKSDYTTRNRYTCTGIPYRVDVLRLLASSTLSTDICPPFDVQRAPVLSVFVQKAGLGLKWPSAGGNLKPPRVGRGEQFVHPSPMGLLRSGHNKTWVVDIVAVLGQWTYDTFSL